MRKFTTFLLTLLCLATAVAQDEVIEEELAEEAVRRYTVEVIVFSYEEDVSVGSEIFLPDEPPVKEEPLLDEEGFPIEEEEDPVAIIADPDDEIEEEPAPTWTIYVDEDIEGDPETEVEANKLSLVLLSEEELTLNDAVRQFELLDAYKTITHFGWTQPVFPEEETPAIELRRLVELPEGLDGTFTLYLSRYLHLVADLALDAPLEIAEPVTSNDPVYSFGDSRSRYDDDFDVAPQPVRYRIQENRIVKNGELRYFDNPKFGVLAKITRVEEEEEEDLDIEIISEPLVSAAGE